MSSNRIVYAYSTADFRGIDVGKWVMALCVILIHSKAQAGVELAYPIEWLIRQAVPFFFICSGYFLERKIFYGGNDVVTICKTYCYRIFRLYAVWTILAIPMAVYVYINNGREWYVDIISYIRGVFIMGANPHSGPLWYLYALCLSAGVICLAFRKGIRLEILWLLCICMLVIEHYINYSDGESGVIERIICMYKLLFIDTQNFLFRGLPFITTGMLLCKYEVKQTRIHIFLLILCLLTFSMFVYVFSHGLGTLSGGIGIFFLFKNCPPQLEIVLFQLFDTKLIRMQSMIVYLVHMFPLFILSLVEDGTCWSPSVGEIFLLCTIVSLFAAKTLILYKDKNRLFRLLF